MMALMAKDVIALAAAWDPIAEINQPRPPPVQGPRQADATDAFLEELNALCERHDMTIDVGCDGDCRVHERNTRTWERWPNSDDVSNTYECDR